MSDEDKSREELLAEVLELRERLAVLVRGEGLLASQGRDSRLALLLENSPDMIAVLDTDMSVLYMNHSVQGRERTDVLGKSALEYMQPVDHARYSEAFRSVLEHGRPERIEVVSSLGYVWETRLLPLREQGHTFAVMGIASDVTHRRQAERALRESEEKLRLAVSATGIGLWKWDARTGEIGWAGAMPALLGEAAVQRPPRTLSEYEMYVHPEDRARVAEAFALLIGQGRCDDLEHRVVSGDGEIHTLVWKGTGLYDEAGVLVSALGGVFDITERKQLEEQLRQAQKMEALGQLTAGIAHNFNNMLTVVLSNVSLAMALSGAQARPRLDDAEHAARRAADMVRQLMVFARRYPVASKHRLELREVVLRTLDICRTTFDRSIEILFSEGALATPGATTVLADPGQLEQVFLNICLNARDAFEEQENPWPRIVLRIDAADGGVLVSIEDNGPGMAEEVRRRMFEPFFTTKEVGRGTGLGLATAYGIVTDHGGRIACESAKGAGATFRVWLPRAADADRAR